MAISAVLMFVIGIFIVRGCSNRSEPAMTCLSSLASASAGKLAPEARCPVSKAAYAVSRKDGRESLTCPDAGNHLLWPPRYARGADGAWRLEQSLPARRGIDPPEIGRKASYISAIPTGTTSVIEIRPRVWWRYLAGPLVQIFALLMIFSFFFQLRPGERAPGGIIVVSLVAALTMAWLLWISGPTVEGSQSFEFDHAQRRMTHRRYLFGAELAPKVYDAADGVCFVRSSTGWAGSGCSLVLLSRPEKGRIVTELIEGLSEEDAALGSWLRERFAP
jgi:hypothetical protein